MNDTRRIPIPWRLRWRRFRYSTLPMLGFFSFVAVSFWLWTNAGEMPHAIGEVEAVRVNVSAGTAGMLLPLPQGNWKLFDVVEPNQIVAQLDDRALRAQMATLQQELAQLRKEIEAATAKLATAETDRARSYQAESVRLRVEFEQRRLAVIEKQMQVEVDRLEAERTKTYFECIQPLYEKKMISEQELANAKSYRDAAAKRLAEDVKVAGEAESLRKEAEERLKQLPDFLPTDAAKELSPLTAAIDVQQTRIAGLEVEINRLTIRAPIGGMICAIQHWPSENLPAGESVLIIASNQARYLVSFVRQEQRIEPKEGMAVDLRKRAVISPPVQTVVERVGPQIEPIPQHLCRDPKIPEWGLPVRIQLPPNFAGRPGELFEVTFKNKSGDAG
jgi:multidrug resistance efflux pump